MTTEAEIEVMRPQAKESRQRLAAGEARNGFSLSLQKEPTLPTS